jgi:hypothetical protein
MATVELAVAMPALIAVLVIALSAVRAGIDQVRCVDAARSAARALARGDREGAAVEQGRVLAPPGATFTVSTGPTTVRVRVIAPAPPVLDWLGISPGLAGSAQAAREDVVGGLP